MADHEEPGDIVQEQEQSENVNEEHLLSKKLNTTSKVWAHFGFKSDGNGFPDPAKVEKPICCYKAVSAT